MTVYLAIPILDELVRIVEDHPDHEDTVKAMASGILNYHFPPTNGYTVTPEQNSDYTAMVTLRIRRYFPGDRGLADHTVVGVERAKDSLNASLGQLENALEHINIKFGRGWAIVVHGYTFNFYEYHASLPEHARLIPWGPPSQQQQNSFHAREDGVVIDWMLRHMAQNDRPVNM
ncbi:uncharacterized protein BDW47DRAFT_128598 [Aspergillus candidus]|uniref:Uncharacterized protein n=1 Tax=Aspergillus candidus TaxID=41067 RepID=A0A2I2F2P6_ASPCN|nr:hypothetical protein BDW47DRAFT_128598 [Aspergillus candidus]PLB34911.1 hypothetical protein BDW47DRAFT_128598 [Aspergillus candidus]